MEILLCDDDELFLSRLQKLVADYFGRIDHQVNVHTLPGGEGYAEVLTNHFYHYLFLDIDMPIHGYTIAEFAQKNSEKTRIIFITSHDNLVFDTFHFSPYYFIRKECLDEDLTKVIEKVHKSIVSSAAVYTFLKPTKVLRVNIDEIMFIESYRNYITIRTEKAKYQDRNTIQAVMEDPKFRRFLVPIKGMMVNYDYVENIYHDELTLKNHNVFHISRTRKAELMKKYMMLLGEEDE